MNSDDYSRADVELHQIMLSRTRLKSSMRTSTLMAGFALVAMVEADIAADTPTALLIPFVICTAILVFVHLLSLLIATYLLPDLDALAAIPKTELAHNSAYISKSSCISISWALSHILGIFLFFIEVILIGFVKFYNASDVYGSSTQRTSSTTDPSTTNSSTPDPTKDRIHVGTAAVVTLVVLGLISTPFIIFWFHHFYRRRIQLQSQQLYKAEQLLKKLDTLESSSHTDTIGRTVNNQNPPSIYTTVDRHSSMAVKDPPPSVTLIGNSNQVHVTATEGHQVRDRIAVVAHSYYISEGRRVNSGRNSLDNFHDAVEGDEFV